MSHALRRRQVAGREGGYAVEVEEGKEVFVNLSVSEGRFLVGVRVGRGASGRGGRYGYGRVLGKDPGKDHKRTLKKPRERQILLTAEHKSKAPEKTKG